MKTRCPDCHAQVSLFVTRCPQCGSPLSLRAQAARLWRRGTTAVRAAWHRLWGGADKTFTTECPRCHERIPFKAPRCPRCSLPSELQFLATWYGRPLMALLQRYANTPERVVRFRMHVFQFVHFIGSVLLLWLLLRMVEARFSRDGGGWGSAAITVALYVPISLLVLRWFLPASTVRVMRTLWPLPKLSLLLNYITLLFVAMLVTDTWKFRSALLLSAFGVAFVGFYLFANLLQPAWETFGQSMGAGDQAAWHAKNPDYRGRGSRYRPGQWS